MKKDILYTLLLGLILISCKKNETKPIMGNLDKRLSETLDSYRRLLSGSEFGWKGYLLIGAKKSVTILCSFDDKNRVKMASDYTHETSESSYIIKALQRPMLIIDTYSILHLLGDPNPAVFGGAPGMGYFSDFEFAIISATTDTIKLEGTFNKSKLYLIRSKSVEDNSNALSAAARLAKNLSKIKTYFIRGVTEGQEYEMRFDLQKKAISFTNIDGGNQKFVESNFYISNNSLIFWDAIVVKNKTLIRLNNITYDDVSNTINFTTNNGDPLQIKEAITPLVYDATVATQFLTNLPNYDDSGFFYSSSVHGFTVDGVSDAYGITKVPNFIRIDFSKNLEPDDFNKGSITFWLGTTYASYGANVEHSMNDGKLIFMASSQYGTIPQSLTQTITDTYNNFLIQGGFYVIQSSPLVYDLVAVKDARSWITFQ